MKFSNTNLIVVCVLVVSDLHSEIKGSRFDSSSPLAMCRGELSAVAAQLSVCEAGGSGSEELKKCPTPSPKVL